MKPRTMLLTTLLLFLIAATPAVYASTLKVTLNPTAKVADISSNSSTTLVLTYPANSTLSRYLRNYSSTITRSGTFNGSSEDVAPFGESLREHDNGVRIQSMNVTYSLNAKGNTTTFVLQKETDISAQVVGVFKVVNGTVKADLGWKAFAVPGDMTLRLGGSDMDVNLVGSAINLQLGDRPLVLAAVVAMFGGDGLWKSPTLDFSALNTPLSNWTRSYNSVTNTTTCSKTVTGTSSLNASASYNGQKYTLSVKSDPSAQVVVQGYAVASGDSLVIQPAPLVMNPMLWFAAGVAIVVAIGGVLYWRRGSRVATQPKVQSISVQ